MTSLYTMSALKKHSVHDLLSCIGLLGARSVAATSTGPGMQGMPGKLNLARSLTELISGQAVSQHLYSVDEQHSVSLLVACARLRALRLM